MAISRSRLLKKKLIAKVTNSLFGQGTYEARLLKKKFYKTFKRPIDVNNPETFNGHIMARLLSRRDPKIVETADKVAVRDYVAQKIGADFLPRNYLIISKPEELAKHFNELPDRFVMKPSHASGYVKFIENKDNHSLQELKKLVQYWLSIDYSIVTGEWMYGVMPRNVIFQEFLNEQTGSIPVDYRFFCFSGKVKFMRLDIDTYVNRRVNLYSRDWTLMPFKFGYPVEKNFPKPANYEKMVEIAEVLSTDFDFVRVDLFDLGNRIVFAELTHAPGGGTSNIYDPPEYDKIMGALFEGRDPVL